MPFAAVLASCSLVLPFDDDKLSSTSGTTSSAGAGSGDQTTGGGGESTGVSAASSGAGAATSGSGSTGGGGAGPTGGGGAGPTGAVVPCNYPEVADCAPQEVCCYDKQEPAIDFCAPEGQCQPQSIYAELQCNDAADCPGQACCAYFVIDGGGNPQIEKTYCDTDCALDDSEAVACNGAADCRSPQTCKLVFGDIYPSYRFCL